MKLLILHIKEDREKAENLLPRFSAIGIQAELYSLGSDMADGLFRLLEEADHLLILYREVPQQSDKLAFSLGFCLGRSVPVFMFCKPDLELPSFPGKLFRSNEMKRVMQYFIGEKQSWMHRRMKELAREKLVSMGLGVSEESMARVTQEGETVALGHYLEAGFSPDVRDGKGVPLICIAARGQHKATVELLVEKGADIDAISLDRGNTALMDASADRHVEIMQLLIDAGASVNIQSKSGQTALILAVGQKAEKESELLIRAGADAEISDALGMSAKKYAQLFGLKELVALMEEYRRDEAK